MERVMLGGMLAQVNGLRLIQPIYFAAKYRPRSRLAVEMARGPETEFRETAPRVELSVRIPHCASNSTRHLTRSHANFPLPPIRQSRRLFHCESRSPFLHARP